MQISIGTTVIIKDENYKVITKGRVTTLAKMVSSSSKKVIEIYISKGVEDTPKKNIDEESL